LETAASLANHVGLDDKPVRSLQVEANTFAAEAGLVERTIAFGLRLAEAIGVEKPMTVGKVRKLVAGAKHAASLSHDLRSLRDPSLFDEAASRILIKADARAQALQNKLTSLAGRLAVELDGQAHDWRGHAQALRAARFPSRLWRSDVRTARNRYKGLMRVRAKPKPFEIAADFETIAECIELIGSFSSDAALQVVCGPHFRGHETAFDRLIAVNTYAVSIKRAYGVGDPTDNRIREVLLEAAPEVLARIATLSEDSEAVVAAQTLDKFDDPTADLDEHLNTLTVRATKTAELGLHARSLSLKPDLRIGDIKSVAQAFAARLEAETGIDSNNKARDLMRARWLGPETDRTLVLRVLLAASVVNQAMLPAAIRRYLFHPQRDSRIAQLKTLQGQIDEALEAVQENWRNASERGNIDEIAFFGSSIRNLAIAESSTRIARALDTPDQLVVWTTLLVARQDCFDNGLGGIIEAFASQPLESSRLSAALDRVFWRTLARAALAEHPVLGRFRGLQLENARERFRHLDEEIIQLQRKTLAAELCHRPIDRGYKGDYRRDDTGLVLVHHEIGKQKRHIAVRELLDRAGRSIQQMNPCFMMSPLSVAQFLKPNRLRFDLVLIDEASQMRPEEALGALARGGQLVVVGDPMQLPPTSFFDRVDRVAEDELEEEEIVDNESILDLALAEFRPSRSLRWHYRSRHESLIAFSNREFYNDLIVFPSPLDPDRDKRDPKLGVYHHFVAGKYKGRVNIEEAQNVAEATTAFMAAEPDKSLGIVTLNQTQRDVLLEELERLVPREPSAQQYIERWEDTLEPLFVKNLENVQGDERDVIFISTVYGPDAATGVVKNQFGPINGKFGHRRLNVLFSRAKHRVEIFTSMRPEDIRPDEKSQRGVRVLKAYLEYSETGRLDAGSVSGREPDSEFEELVRDRLQDKGFNVVSQVGVAGYFIDLAVKHPKRSGFVLGIECDGASYHSTRSARDRDRLRQQVLERLQWNVYRIWSTDWFQNPAQELRRLLTHLDRLINEGA
jgi:very-short-patch-repair endonuclease